MTRLKGWILFGEIKNMKERGFNKSQISRNLSIDFETVSKYWDMAPDEYAELLKKRKSRVKKLDQYEDEIVLWLIAGSFLPAISQDPRAQCHQARDTQNGKKLFEKS